jgi:predicted peptidase
MRTSRWFMPTVCFLSFAATSASFAAEQPAPGKQVATSATIEWKGDEGEKKTTPRFLLALPDDYEKNATQKWPLVLFLHGSGERGDDLEIVKKHGPPKLVSEGKSFPFVVVSPQCEKDSRWNPHELAKLVDHLANTYRIDRQRLYVTGLSMGGGGTWSLVSEYPKLFAAAIPICGRGDLANVPKFAKLPIWIFIGAKDKAETVQNCEQMAAEIKKAGGEGKLKVYPDLGHDCWTVTYENPEVYAWLLSHRTP